MQALNYYGTSSCMFVCSIDVLEFRELTYEVGILQVTRTCAWNRHPSELAAPTQLTWS